MKTMCYLFIFFLHSEQLMLRLNSGPRPCDFVANTRYLPRTQRHWFSWISACLMHPPFEAWFLWFLYTVPGLHISADRLKYGFKQKKSTQAFVQSLRQNIHMWIFCFHQLSWKLFPAWFCHDRLRDDVSRGKNSHLLEHNGSSTSNVLRFQALGQFHGE